MNATAMTSNSISATILSTSFPPICLEYDSVQCYHVSAQILVNEGESLIGHYNV